MPRRRYKGLRACPRQHLRRIPANEIQLLACPDGGPRVLRACPRQHLRRIPANEIQLLACPDGAPRVCGYAHANICAGYLLTRFNCWRDQTVLQRFAGMPTPTRSCPSLRKECLPYTKGNPREKSEEPYYLGSCIEMCTYGKL